MSKTDALAFKKYVKENSGQIGKVVDFDPDSDKLLNFDFTDNNKKLSPETVADTTLFSKWINGELTVNNCRYGIGGYDEHRTLYARSVLFDNAAEARRLHLGVDIWGPALTPVYNPIAGHVHSFNFNNHFGDYGATIILEHDFEGLKFHSLYGHLSLASLNSLTTGKFIPKGEMFTEFGLPAENGFWPPHLHLQLIWDMQGKIGDYPGVCAFSEREKYLQNCPDPNDILACTF